jgi:hypothetical protein
MNATNDDDGLRARPLRLWPGVVIVLLEWTARIGLPAVDPDYLIYGVFSGIAGLVALLVWWLLFSQSRRSRSTRRRSA